jgi:hypothetical protein
LFFSKVGVAGLRYSDVDDNGGNPDGGHCLGDVCEVVSVARLTV